MGSIDILYFELEILPLNFILYSGEMLIQKIMKLRTTKMEVIPISCIIFGVQSQDSLLFLHLIVYNS